MNKLSRAVGSTTIILEDANSASFFLSELESRCRVSVRYDFKLQVFSREVSRNEFIKVITGNSISCTMTYSPDDIMLTDITEEFIDGRGRIYSVHEIIGDVSELHHHINEVEDDSYSFLRHG